MSEFAPFCRHCGALPGHQQIDRAAMAGESPWAILSALVMRLLGDLDLAVAQEPPGPSRNWKQAKAAGYRRVLRSMRKIERGEKVK